MNFGSKKQRDTLFYATYARRYHLIGAFFCVGDLCDVSRFCIFVSIKRRTMRKFFVALFFVLSTLAVSAQGSKSSVQIVSDSYPMLNSTFSLSTIKRLYNMFPAIMIEKGNRAFKTIWSDWKPTNNIKYGGATLVSHREGEWDIMDIEYKDMDVRLHVRLNDQGRREVERMFNYKRQPKQTE